MLWPIEFDQANVGRAVDFRKHTLSGSASQLPDRELDQLLFVMTGLSPRISLKDLLCRTKGDVSLGIN